MKASILMKKNSGFSLMEMMISVGIIAVMSAIAIPNYINWLPKHRINGGARDIYSAMQFARIRAVKEKTSVTINFNPGTDDYVVYIDDGRGGGSANNNIPDGTETIKTGQMPAGVDILPSTSFSGGVPRTRFDPRGLPGGTGGSVDLQSLQDVTQRREVALRISGSPIIRVR